MLSWTEVLRHVKTNLGFPYHVLEYNDTEIVDMLRDGCLRKFSTYFPEKTAMSVSTDDHPEIIVPSRQDMIYVNDPDGQEILSIDEFVSEGSDHFFLGHPWWGAFNHNQIPEEMALQAFKANNLRGFSIFNYTQQFYPPNKLRITPRWRGNCTLEYSRVHTPDLSSIPADLAEYFKDLTLAKLKMHIGSLRKMYTTITTPFGEIPLNGAELYSEGESAWNTLIDKMETSSAPYIILDKG